MALFVLGVAMGLLAGIFFGALYAHQMATKARNDYWYKRLCQEGLAQWEINDTGTGQTRFVLGCVRCWRAAETAEEGKS